MRTLRKFGIGLALLLSLSGILWSQFRGRRGGGYTNLDGISSGGEYQGKEGEFHFIRLEYRDRFAAARGFGFGSRNGMGRGWWMVDWPDADQHITTGIQRLTRIQMGEPRHIPIDDRIFNYPWIYATQTGWWSLSDEETARLREYLQRGGFLMTDDFWSNEEWQTFAGTMAKVLPGRDILDIAPDEPIMHVLYDIKERTFIPGSRHLCGGSRGGGYGVCQPPGTTPTWRMMYDDRDRAIVAVNYQMDVADAWEFADDPGYPEAMTALATRFGINYIIYSMTH
ncbi:MAG: DUF4159 domain-containing protein [Bryobacteraceae bacterium]